METTNNNQPMLIDGLSCICGGSKIYYSTINVEDMSNVNQLACPNCGIIMRSPPTDENGEWLKNHWKKTHGIVKTLTAERVGIRAANIASRMIAVRRCRGNTDWIIFFRTTGFARCAGGKLEVRSGSD